MHHISDSFHHRLSPWTLSRPVQGPYKKELSANGELSAIGPQPPRLKQDYRLNTKLEANGYPPMSSLVKDLSDGVRLIQLMVCMSFGVLYNVLMLLARKSWV